MDSCPRHSVEEKVAHQWIFIGFVDVLLYIAKLFVDNLLYMNL